MSATQGKPLKQMMRFVRPHLGRIITGLLGMSVFTGLSLLPPLFLRALMNDVVEPDAWQLLGPIIALIIAVPAVAWIIRFVNIRLLSLAGFRLVSDLRMALYRKILALSMRFHNDHSSGVLVTRMMEDVTSFQYLITGETLSVLVDLIVFVASFAIVVSLSPPLAFVILGILVLYVVAYRIFAKRIKSASTSYRGLYDRIAERLQETVAGVRQVRIYNRGPTENETFLDRTDESLKLRLMSNIASVNLSTSTTLIAGFGSAAVAALGAYFVLVGRLQYGDVLAINTYIWMALTPAIRLTTLAGELTETMVSIRRIVEVLDEPEEISSPPGAPPMPEGKGAVEFRDVHFSYTPEVPLYRGVSVKVEPGMTVALVGHTGCGKTTFTQLLMRHWDIQRGQILIDGIDIRTVTLRSLRHLFGVVLQSPVVFDGTLAENIAYGDARASRPRIIEAAQAAEIYDTALRFSDGMDTVVGTHGVKLSLGEKQRVSIARAILKDPVILVMDEATSSLDSESEQLIQTALTRVLKGRTSFVVAHRLSTIVGADMIVVMDQGAIVERGVHSELMQIENGHYRHLYEELRASVGEMTGGPAGNGGSGNGAHTAATPAARRSADAP